MSMQQSPQRTPGVGSFLSDGVSLVQEDPRIVLVTVVGGALSAVPIVGFLLSFLVSGYAYVFAQKARGGPVTQRVSLAKRFVFLFVALIIVSIAVAIGLLLLVIPGIYLAIRFALATPAIMIDGYGPIDGIKESWDRSSGNAITIFLFGLVIFVASLVISAPVVFVLGTGIVGSLVSGVLGGVVTAVLVSGLVLMYSTFEGPRGGAQQAGQPHQGGQQQYQGGQQQHQGQQQYQGGQQQYQGGQQQQRDQQRQGGQQRQNRQPQGGQQDDRQQNNRQQDDRQPDDQW